MRLYHIRNSLLVIAVSGALAACESPQTAVPVQPVSIKADNFCPVMRRLRPPDGIPTWDVLDSQQTIDYVRKLEAIVVKKCLPSRSTPTS